MIDIAWSHFILLAVVVLIFLGPKELPHALKTVGRWMGRARSYLDYFQSQAHSLLQEDVLSHPSLDSSPSSKEKEQLFVEEKNLLTISQVSISKNQWFVLTKSSRPLHPWVKSKS